MDQGIPTRDEMWVQAIQLRVEDMLQNHQEIDQSSLALLVETIGAGLRSSEKLLRSYQSGCSFIESDFDNPDEEFQPKLSSTKRMTTKTAYVLPNGVRYSISKPIFNSKRGKKNG